MRLIIPHELTDLNTYINAERSNKYAAAAIKERDTNTAWLYSKRQKNENSNGRYRITFHWYCKDKRKDPDNIAFARKFILDGMVKAGVLKNDGWNNVASLSDEFYIDKEKPRIEVQLVESEGLK